jgi:exonuclease VII small subunit
MSREIMGALGGVITAGSLATMAYLDGEQLASSAKETLHDTMADIAVRTSVNDVTVNHLRLTSSSAALQHNRGVFKVTAEVSKNCQTLLDQCQDQIPSKLSNACQEVIKGKSPRQFFDEHLDKGLSPKVPPAETNCYIEIGKEIVACETAQYDDLIANSK